MIVAELIGGLGNQMFQYATARTIADRLGVELLLDATSFETYKLRSQRLTKLNVRARLATQDDLRQYLRLPRRAMRLLSKMGINNRFYFEPDHSFNNAVMSLPAGSYLSGYFQSESYFSSNRNQLVEDMIPLSTPSIANNRLLEQIKSSKSVSIHIRRGDYLNINNLSIHGICSINYYKRSVQYIVDRYDDVRFFVFSDDPRWTQHNLPFLGTNAVFISGNEDEPEWDIQLMAYCQHHVIANSSFSWWGAWLGNSNGITIAPDPWFKEIEMKDITPGNWITFDRE